jgi:hypothetical protein
MHWPRWKEVADAGASASAIEPMIVFRFHDDGGSLTAVNQLELAEFGEPSKHDLTCDQPMICAPTLAQRQPEEPLDIFRDPLKTEWMLAELGLDALEHPTNRMNP